MKITENVTVYRCDYCSKKYFVKHACINHETYCFRNPSNFHACFQHCKHLIKGVEQYTTEDSGCGGEIGVNRVTFQCAITKQFMYSFKAERLNIVPTYNDYDASEEGRIYVRMPLECEHYKYEIDAYFQL